jgi:hypothetical protein
MSDLGPIPSTRSTASSGRSRRGRNPPSGEPAAVSIVAKPQGTTAEFFARDAVEARARASLGLRLGVEALPDETNVVSLAAMHSATLGDGLHKLARYKRLVCPERISIDVEDGEARLRFEWLLANAAPPTLLTDIIFAGITNLAQRGTMTPLRPRRLEFIRRRANEALLRRHFRCELRFNAPHDVLVFDEAAPLCQWSIAMPSFSQFWSRAGASGGTRTHARTLADGVRAALNETMRRSSCHHEIAKSQA